MREEEVEVEQVLPEELEAILEEAPSRGKTESLLRRLFYRLQESWLGGQLHSFNRWLDGILAGKRERGIRGAAIDSRKVSRVFGIKLWRIAARRGTLEQSKQLDRREDFSQLLTPLSSAEILLLEKEIEADATVFSRIEVVRETALLQQRKAFLAGMIVGILFALLAGPAYITETLYGSGLPGWVPLSQEVRDWFSALFFVLGVLLPLWAIFQITEAVRIMLLYREEGDREIRAAWALPLFLAVGALLALLLGGIIAALLLIVFVSFWLSAERSKRDEDLE